jgi:hypothetical protein
MPPRKDRTSSTLDPEAIAAAASAAGEEAARVRADTVEVLNRLGRRLTQHIAQYAERDDGDVEGVLPAVRDLANVLSIMSVISARQAAASWRARVGRPNARPGWYVPRLRGGGRASQPAWWDGRRWWPAPPGWRRRR